MLLLVLYLIDNTVWYTVCIHAWGLDIVAFVQLYLPIPQKSINKPLLAYVLSERIKPLCFVEKIWKGISVALTIEKPPYNLRLCFKNKRLKPSKDNKHHKGLNILCVINYRCLIFRFGLVLVARCYQFFFFLLVGRLSGLILTRTWLTLKPLKDISNRDRLA